ncbi:hypothetical protein SNEBB_004598 [Seison nebaliae]|nr:hypothetical protein SNEBB_004598 [Seison nebaliae]
MSENVNLPPQISFPKEEENILEYWKKIRAFETSCELSKGRKEFSFYDGPPFATGLPHYGHILAGTIKDTVCRWAYQTGHNVERRFGWDCHGVPVEYEIDKKLGIKSSKDVKKMGIDKYNDECRKIVDRYSGEWETIITRVGRWIDFRNDYKTMYPWFMESVWWTFQQLFNKGLVYQGVKVVPYSTGCSTPLSNFEAQQNYRKVRDPAVIITFPLMEEMDVELVAWTTTPWTLPSNLALCLNPTSTYILIQDKKTTKKYIIMENRVSEMFKDEDDYEIVKKMIGKDLEGKKYKPLFNYFYEKMKERAFRINCDSYVTDDSGTGIVHQAPFFGEDDHRVCLLYNIICKEGDVICPVDEKGCFTHEVSHFKGEYVKEADKKILRYLKGEGRVFKIEECVHDYPFCWRSNTPLLYKAVKSWFIRVELLIDRLLKNTSETYWVPDFVKEKRFGNWLKNARDWAFSRNRYWGNPIPIWISDDGEEVVCIGSIKQLEELSGEKNITDLHSDKIDHITIPSKLGKGKLKRIPEVFDCWFESGSMPFAQKHFPFEQKELFEQTFPANFIAEGIDQTRGWFYTLIIISTAIYDTAPFKNLVCNGIVLNEKGEKMSKSKQNFPDPIKVVNNFGADAIRLYLITSPAAHGDALKFQQKGVQDVLKDVFIPMYSSLRFLIQNIQRLEKEDKVIYQYDHKNEYRTENFLDVWILSYVQSLLADVTEKMNAYKLYMVTPSLVKVIDILCNWYVRLSRKRIKGEDGKYEALCSIHSLFDVLLTLCRLLAPFIPFLTEHIYQILRKFITEKSLNVDSIHYLLIPKLDKKYFNLKIERSVSTMQTIIECGRYLRDNNNLPLKYPLSQMVVILEDIFSIKWNVPYYSQIVSAIKSELNIRQLKVTTNQNKYKITLNAKADYKVLGSKIKQKLKEFTPLIEKMTDEQIRQLQNDGHFDLIISDKEIYRLLLEDIRIFYNCHQCSEFGQLVAKVQNNVIVLLDISQDETSILEGVAKEIINRIQKLRLAAKLTSTDDIIVKYSTDDDYLNDVIEKTYDFIVHGINKQFTKEDINNRQIIKDTVKVKSGSITFSLFEGKNFGKN